MNLLRILSLSGLAIAAVHVSGAAGESSSLAAVVGEDVPFVIHVREMSQLVESWQYTPVARMWAEPEVKRFFAPAIAKFSGEDAESFGAKMKAETGLGPREVLDLFPGEVLLAVLDIPDRKAGPQVEPRFVLGAEVGENRSTLESLIEQAQEENLALTEEFQGETLYVAIEATAEGEPRETLSWVFLDDVFWLASPKDALQEIIANTKRGGASSPVTAAPGFAAVYQDNPNAQLAFYLNLEAVMQEVVSQIDAEVGPDGTPAGPFANLGVSTADAFRALGLSSLGGLYAAATIEPIASTWTVGLKWNEQRGLLKMLAYGEAPAPRPSFASDTWYNATASRFSIAALVDAIKETARDLNPAYGAMIEQQIVGINGSLGIDIERDFFGSFGDEILQAADIRDAAPGALSPILVNQLIAFSLSNPDAFRRSVDSLLAMVPPDFTQMITPREYLGETINTIAPPTGDGSFNVSYAIARNQLLVGIGSPSMVETVIQSFGGTGGSLWDEPDVAAALAELPSGSSAVSYSDIRRAVSMGFNAIAAVAAQPTVPNEEGVSQPPGWLDWIDPTVVPRPEVIEKYWSTAAGAIYREPDGLRSVGRVRHVE